MISIEGLRSKEVPVALVGLGYVGLPLAVALSRHFSVIGFDVSASRIEELKEGRDRTGEVEDQVLGASTIEFTCDPVDLSRAGVIIVAVPTPIDQHRRPDLTPITKASVTVGKHLSPGSVVVFESTVYPGLTEEICIPLLEQHSGLACYQDFSIGYSPERINPGDKEHTLETIIKVVAGGDDATCDLLVELYGTVVSAGVHRASSIKVAEAAKVIENTQRDLNIALMNELALIFERLDIDTREVLEAAGTKWNFLPFFPGLVGGHCIGVDPYYLTFKAEALGFHPQVILAGRRINDYMGKYVAEAAIKKMNQRGCRICGSRVAVLGLTFKENVPDLRNTRVIDVIEELREYLVDVLVHDPIVDPDEARQEFGIELCSDQDLENLDAVIICVPHRQYLALEPQAMLSWFADPKGALILDVKGQLDRKALGAAGAGYWRL